MAESAIQKVDVNAPLRHPRNCVHFMADIEAGTSLVRAWPGDLDKDRRVHKTKQLLEQAAITIATSGSAMQKLQQCVTLSVIDSLVACASMDLSINKAMGEAYLVPYGNICTLMVGYRGFIKLMVNAGFVTRVESVLVYEGEPFKWWRDETGPHLMHEPDAASQGKVELVTAAYAMGYTRDGAPMIEVMNAEQLAAVQKASKGAGGPAYRDWPTEMMRKAPVRRLQKYIPKTADNLAYDLLVRACEHDNQQYDLSPDSTYGKAAQAYKDKQQAKLSDDWQSRVTGEPAKAEAPEPAPEKKPEYTEDGHLIPDDVGKPKDGDDG